MPAISKIRFTNVIYEDGNKRYNDDMFHFDGENGAILLENGGGKTVFIQTALQAILPHTSLADRKIKETLKLEEGPAHVGIEWIVSDKPRRYAVTAVSLFLGQDKVDSYRFVDEYRENDPNSLAEIPFVQESSDGKRPAGKGEIHDYYKGRTSSSGELFDTLTSFKEHIEDHYGIITKEWENIVKINSAEGGVEAYFDQCKTSKQLFEQLLIPTVENALAANDGDSFVDTFSTRRKGFKEYQQFQETIQENKLIQEKLEHYVDVFARKKRALDVYENEKRTGKAYSLFYQKRLEQVELTMKSIEAEVHQLEKLLIAHEKKQRSFQIAVAKEKLAHKQEQLDQVKESLDREKEKRAEAERMYQSIRLALHKKDRDNGNDQLTVLKLQIDRLDQELDVDDLKGQLERNEREIRGYFITLKEQFDKEANELEHERRTQENLLNTEKDQLEKETKLWLELDKSCGILESRLDDWQDQLAKLADKLNLDLEKETIHDVQKRWSLEAQTLDESITKLKTSNKKLDQEAIEKTREREALQAKLVTVGSDLTRVESIKEQMEAQHDEVKGQLRFLDRRFELIASLFTQQETLLGQMSDQMKQLADKKEQLLKRERVAYRFVDDYQEIPTFFADRIIYDAMQNWKNQFHYLATGVEFLKHTGVELHSMQNQHYWPISLITTTEEKSHLIERINKLQAEMQFPIIVLSNDEAHALLEQTPHWDTIQPKHWERNLNAEVFQQWKEQLLAQATLIKEERIEAEATLEKWKTVYNQLKVFYDQHTLADYQEVVQEIQELKKAKEQEEERSQLLSTQLHEIREKLSNQAEQMRDHESTFQQINQLLTTCQSYVDREKEVHELVRKINNERDERAKQLKKKEQLDRSVSHLEQELIEVVKEINDQRTNMRIEIEAQDLFKETKHITKPLFTDKRIFQLKQEQHVILQQLNKLSVERTQLEQQMKSQKERVERAEAEIASLHRQFDLLDESLRFPIDGEERLKSLEIKKRDLEIVIKKEQEKFDTVRDAKSKQERDWERELEEFLKRFAEEEILSFAQALPTVKDELVEEKKDLQQRKYQLEKKKQETETEQKQVEEIVQEYDKLNVKHEFLAPTVEEQPLDQNVRLTLPYNSKKLFKDIEGTLLKQLKNVEELQSLLSKERDNLKDFCRDFITNRKLQERTVSGLNLYVSYDQIVEFQTRMTETLTRAVQVAEANMKKEDEEIEQFIHRMYTHIVKIVQELKTIPKNTRVKVDDSSKTIFDFSIPEWNEHEAKQDLRQYIQSLANRLDTERFQDVEGKENTAKVQQEVEQALHSRQLLHIVTKQQQLSVLCRKVTNNKSVTSRRYVWETTNNWSGGEKWSKNMTLFLGLLNYVAEKRLDIRPSKKRSRTVIVDNPFGKASSEHVLQPVFFIAEQLGFQIIALTAHAEGKFLRDYFPVIYSCRLRQTGQAGKQIMTKEKQIRTAYFQDNDPDALLRIGEQEQIELF